MSVELQLMSNWRQFTVYTKNSKGKYFPVELLDTFLPDFITINKPYITKWHFLFEPSVIVRYEAEFPEGVYESAQRIAEGYKLIIEPGDTEASSPDGHNDFIWPGQELEFYGPGLAPANINFLQATSELSLEINKLPAGDKQVDMLQKHIHLLCNIAGCNYAEEAIVCQEKADRAQGNYRKYGRT